MTDRLVTIVLSVVTTWALMHVTWEPPKVLEVDRLIVRKELIVSDTGEPWEKGLNSTKSPGVSMRGHWGTDPVACGCVAA